MRETLYQKVNERIERHTQNRLAEFKLGRIVLHLLCCCQDRHFLWHWRGILREVSKGALLVSPALKCAATERCFENAGGARFVVKADVGRSALKGGRDQQ